MQIIIPQNPVKREEWLYHLSQVITDPHTLFAHLNLDAALLAKHYPQIKQAFALRVPLQFVKRMQKGNINDPLLRQVMLADEELIEVPGYSADPLEEKMHTALPNLLHKYQNRVLLITKTNCAINCRYCFRRHFPYHENQGNKHNWQNALQYVAAHPEVNEVILSGGDPLMAKDHELDWLISQIESIPHIERLRIHTRLAVVIPARITATLCQRLDSSRLQTIFVTHINHANEIDDHVKSSMKRLTASNVLLLNQSVLLKGVNDNVTSLKQLSNQLFKAGILPYYLHVLDKVAGAAHFFVDDEIAKTLMKQLAAEVSGYLLPKLARETSGEYNKTLIHY